VNVDPSTITDTSAGITPSTQAVLTWSVSSNVAPDAFYCSVNGGSTQSSPTSIGGYPAAQDGAQTVSVSCHDEYGMSQTASVGLTVVAPPSAPQDQFACVANPDATVTCTWFTYEPGAQCYVERLSTQGVLTGNSGGSSGDVTTGVLFAPDLFQLVCANTGTTASPNPVPVSP
jgi:hypothetical protein